MSEDPTGISRRNFVGGGAAAATVALAAASQIASAATPTMSGKASVPTIFATGGGFFPQAWEQPLFPPYLLGLTPAKSPRICYLGPASGDNPAGFDSFARGMERFDCTTQHFNIYQPTTLDFADYLMSMDIIFVGGGSTKNLMALWREWEFDKALHAAWQAGVVLSGGSAGMICWFEGGLTDSYPKVLNWVKATGFLKGSANPHYNIRPDRKTRFREFIADGSLASPGLALDQDVAVLYKGNEIAEIVSARKTAGAFQLTKTATGYDEKPLPVRYLGT